MPSGNRIGTVAIPSPQNGWLDSASSLEASEASEASAALEASEASEFEARFHDETAISIAPSIQHASSTSATFPEGDIR
jgi:hypothetical protein